MRWLRHPLFLLTLAACGAVLVVLAVSPRWTHRYIAEQLRAQLAAADDAEAAAIVTQLAECDDAATHHLVELLDDERLEVRAAARESLRKMLAAWSNHPAPSSERSASLLAAALAARGPPRDLHNLVFVKLTAIKLLRWEFRGNSVDQSQYLANLSSILERTLNVRSEETAENSENWPIANEEVPTAEPLEQAPDALAESVEAIPDTVAPVPEPAFLPRGDEEPVSPELLDPVEPRSIRSSEIGVAEGLQTSAIDGSALRSLATRSLIRHLHGTSAIAAAAQRELQRRGFGITALQLARGLDDPDPRVRRQLVEALPQAEGVESAAWLWELARDDDPTVRRAALEILATSNNPHTQARVTQLRGPQDTQQRD